MRNSLDKWVDAKTGGMSLCEYQQGKLQDTIDYVKENSKFYKEKLAGFDLFGAEIPFTTCGEFYGNESSFVCVRQDEISRIVTTSGSEGEPKRVYFTLEDQDTIVDHFYYGMQNLIDAEDIFMVLLPHERPGSVGDLLSVAVERLGAKVIRCGIPDGNTMNGVTSMVGLPGDIETLARNTKGYDRMKSVLLTASYVTEGSRQAVRDIWKAKPFEHYGMTEMGFGGAVSCSELEGMHLRECDIYFEIITPDGEVISDETPGELVFTTLTRKGMPLVRYRTGDITHWINKPCRCGSELKRIARVGDRGVEKGRRT